MTNQQKLQQALQHHHAGRVAEAEILYRQILKEEPGNADALHLLGVASIAQGLHQAAIEFIGQAIRIAPKNAAYHSNLGLALTSLGWLAEAVASIRQAIALQPDFAEAYINLSEALRQFQQFDQSVQAARSAVELRPDSGGAYASLGSALRAAEKIQEAIEAYQQATRLTPDLVQAWSGLGVTLVLDRQYESAGEAFRMLTRLRPDWAEPFGYLGGCLRRLDRIDDAVFAFQQSVQIKPQLADAWNDLGSALRDRGDLDEAIEAYRQAMESNPALIGAHSNLIHAMYFHPAADASSIEQEHARWRQKYATDDHARYTSHPNDRDPNRPLKIGYVSAHFFDHPDARRVLPLLEAHQSDRVIVHCYASVRRPDAMTERHQRAAPVWRDVLDRTDAELAEIIHADQVDILVDLSLHSAHNRMPTFVRKPAPLQLSWLGYPGDCGLASIDAWIGDDRLVLQGAADQRALRLPGCWICYDSQVGSEEFPISDLPAEKNGFITFGSLDDPAKINAVTIHHWAAVMRAVRGSRMILTSFSSRQRDQVASTFSSAGIAPDRIEFVGPADRAEQLRRYGQIDLVLDTFPFNGVASTCDALWMGVPVLTLSGLMPHSRAGRSVLAGSGLPGFAANSRQRLVEIAEEWSDPHKLAERRKTLRQMVQSSPLMDTPRFARELESVYRDLWKSWCEKTR